MKSQSLGNKKSIIEHHLSCTKKGIKNIFKQALNKNNIGTVH
jgi:hypothetical protein